MHIKRKTIPVSWPITRTGTKYVAVPSHNQYSAMPLIMVMRDILKLVKNKKELKKILHEKKIFVNGQIVEEQNYPVNLFDSVSVPSIKKYYRADLENKRMALKEINAKDNAERIYKVIGKKILPGKKVQLNLSDGKNLLSSEKIAVGNFVVLNNAENKIIKIIPLGKNTEVMVIKGRHIGKRGKIKEITKEGNNLVAEISCKAGDIKANINNLFVTE